MTSRFPSRLDENISSDTPVRLVNQIVDELDVSPLLSTYKGGVVLRIILACFWVLLFAYLTMCTLAVR